MSGNELFISKVVSITIALGAIGGLVGIATRGGRWLPTTKLQWLGGILSCLVLVISLLGLGAATVIGHLGFDAPMEYVGTSLPPLDLRTVAENSELKLEHYTGQVVLLNYWATWCTPCIEEMPSLEKLNRTYKDEGLVIICVSDESRDKLLSFMETSSFDMISAYIREANEVSRSFVENIQIRPVSFIVDRQGVVQDAIIGTSDYEGFEEAILKYL